MSTAPTPDRLSAILSGMDRLDPHAPSVAEAVKAGCANAGWTVTDPAIEQALTPMSPAATTEAALAPPPITRWKRWGLRAWRALRPDVIGAVLAAGWVGKQAFGEAFVHLLGTTQFSNALLLFCGLGSAWTLLQGTWATAQTEQPLHPKWTSLWTPIHMVVVASCLLPTLPGPLGQPISALAKGLLALFS